jgi:hypothetical protein
MSTQHPQTSTFYHLLRHQFQLEPGREKRAQEIHSKGWVVVNGCTAAHVEAKVSGNYDVSIDLRGGVSITCNCPDYQQRGRHMRRPCKHILALALEADTAIGVQPSVQTAPEPATSQQPATDPLATLPDFDTAEPSFANRVRSAIGSAIAALADLVETTVRAGEIPFLIGPTGCGKTSAARLVATRNRWGFEEVTGSESFADADLLGLRTDHMEQPGIFARAFRRAREDETVLVLLDEMTRFNVRCQDVLMRPFQSTPVPVARAMGLEVNEPIRLVEAPLWGIEWAPVSRVHLVLAANPWGSVLDPALVRRVWPLPVDLDETVVQLFDAALADAIRASWNAVRQGELPLPIEYQALARARHPGDTAILRAYLVRLGAVDKAAADGFRTVLEGMGLQL